MNVNNFEGSASILWLSLRQNINKWLLFIPILQKLFLTKLCLEHRTLINSNHNLQPDRYVTLRELKLSNYRFSHSSLVLKDHGFNAVICIKNLRFCHIMHPPWTYMTLCMSYHGYIVVSNLTNARCNRHIWS